MAIERGAAGDGFRNAGRSRLAGEVPSGVLTLADVSEGERVAIQAFLSGSVRRACAAHELRTGTVLVCRERSAGRVLVERTDGHSVAFDRISAALVQVEPRRNEGGA